MEISDIIINGIVAIVSSGAASGVSWFFARKKYNSEVDNNNIENMKETLNFYITLSDDNKKRLDNATERNGRLEKEVQELRAQLLNLMTIMCTDLSCKLRKGDYETILNQNTNEK